LNVQLTDSQGFAAWGSDLGIAIEHQEARKESIRRVFKISVSPQFTRLRYPVWNIVGGYL
jgi:hypothetical protein